MNVKAFKDVFSRTRGTKFDFDFIQSSDFLGYDLIARKGNVALRQVISLQLIESMGIDGAETVRDGMMNVIFWHENKGRLRMKDLMELVNACEPTNDPIDPRVESALSQAIELDVLGFKAQAKKIREKATLKMRMNKITEGRYIRIREENISRYLEKLARDYDKEHGQAIVKRPAIANAITSEYSNLMREALNNNQMMHFQEQYAQISLLDQTNAFGRGMAFNAAMRVDQLAPYCVLRVPTIHANGSGPIGQFVWREMRVADYEGIPPKMVLEKFAVEKKKALFDEYTVATVEGVHDPLLLGRLSNTSDRFFLGQWGDDVSLDDVI